MIFLKKSIILIFICLLFSSLFLLFSVTQAEDKPTVAVVGFDNKTSYNLPSIDEKVFTIYLNTALVNSNKWRVIEKNKVDKVIKENIFLRFQDIMNNRKASIKMGELLGAEYLITGSITNIDIKEKSAELSEDVEIKGLIYILETNIRILNIKTREIEWQHSYKDQNIYYNETKSSINIDNIAKNIFSEKIAPNFRKNMEENLKLTQNEEGLNKIKVEFTSNPKGATVELDNLFIGNTPVEKELEKGLYVVKITKGSYKTWEKKIQILQSKTIKAELNKLDETSEDKVGKIKVKFTSDPKGAAVEIDNLYIGNTPIEKNIEKGTHEISITMGGYEPWIKKIKIIEPVNINANLGLKNKENNK